MIRWVVGTSLRFRFIVVALGLGLTYFVAQRLKDIPIDVFPEFAPARVEVQTLCLGLSPAEVEAGYVLTCQSHPTTPSATVDYDA